MNSPTLPDLSALGPAPKRAARTRAENARQAQQDQGGPEPPSHPLWEALPRDAQATIARMLRPEEFSSMSCSLIEDFCAQYGFRECRQERFWDELNASWGLYGPHGSWEAFQEARRAHRVLFMQEAEEIRFLLGPDDALALPELPRSPRAFFRGLCGLSDALWRLQAQQGLVWDTLGYLSFQNLGRPADVFVVFNREVALSAARLGVDVPHGGAALQRFIYADDLELARVVARRDWAGLGSFSERVRDDFETMRIAARAQGEEGFLQASERLRGDVEFCLVALKTDPTGHFYDGILEPARSNSKVVMQLVHTVARTGWWKLLADAFPNMVWQPRFFVRVVRAHPHTFEYMAFLWALQYEGGAANAQLGQLYLELAVEAISRQPSLLSKVAPAALPAVRGALELHRAERRGTRRGP